MLSDILLYARFSEIYEMVTESRHGSDWTTEGLVKVIVYELGTPSHEKDLMKKKVLTWLEEFSSVLQSLPLTREQVWNHVDTVQDRWSLSNAETDANGQIIIRLGVFRWKDGTYHKEAEK